MAWWGIRPTWWVYKTLSSDNVCKVKQCKTNSNGMLPQVKIQPVKSGMRSHSKVVSSNTCKRNLVGNEWSHYIEKADTDETFEMKEWASIKVGLDHRDSEQRVCNQGLKKPLEVRKKYSPECIWLIAKGKRPILCSGDKEVAKDIHGCSPVWNLDQTQPVWLPLDRWRWSTQTDVDVEMVAWAAKMQRQG